MKYKEVKGYYDSGILKHHHFLDENGEIHGEFREYHRNGQLMNQTLIKNCRRYSEYTRFDDAGMLDRHTLCGEQCEQLANVLPSGCWYEHRVVDSAGSLSSGYADNLETGEVIRTVVDGKYISCSEEELIQIAKEHGLPLLSELPKTEEEVTLWKLKHPDMPVIGAPVEKRIESKVAMMIVRVLEVLPFLTIRYKRSILASLKSGD